MKKDTPRPVRLRDYRPPAFLIDTVDLDVSLDATATRIRSRLAIRRNPKAGSAAEPLRLDGEHLQLVSATLDGRPLGPDDYRLEPGALVIAGPPGRPFRLEIETVIDPTANTALQGLYRTRGIYCTQCEAEGFRRITYYLDRPDVMARFTTRIEADRDEASVLLSNGNPVERGTLAGGRRHYAVWRDPHPKPCYLFALVGGNLGSIASSFRTMEGREVDLRIYVEPGKEDRCVWAMDALKRSMRWDEQRFGRAYDLDVFNIVAVSDFNMGAMENKGLNVFNDRLILASPQTATDAIYEAIEAVVAHEYFHNWTGNRITCRDWFQLCLKEGLTVFRDQEFSADERSPAVQRISDVRQLRAAQFAEDAGPLAHPVRPKSYLEINNFYTSTVYEKGAELVRMIKTIVGADAFRRGMDLYFERHDGTAATVEDFLACFEAAAGIDLDQFKLWYTQAGTPELTCDLTYDRTARTAELTVTQETPPTPGEARKKAFHIPLRLGLIGENGGDLALELDRPGALDGDVLSITRRSQTFRFRHVSSRPVPSLLRDFSAPVKLTIDLADRDLEFLMLHDSDLFNRWQAASDFATRVLVRLVKNPGSERVLERARALAAALGRFLSDASLEHAYVAEALRIPSEADIAREIARNVDPAAIHAARRHLQRLIAIEIGNDLQAVHERLAEEGPFSPSAEAAGRRALRNVAMSLLSERNLPRDRERLSQHYWQARSMTEQAHALALFAQRPGSRSRQVLDDFLARWQHDHVVIDTWFAVQAISPASQTLARLRKLMRHPLFSLKAPNKVRALIGSFANANQLQFNRPDGAGYEFIGDQVLALDKINPQVAARLLGAFRSWRTLEAGRRGRARAALERVAGSPELSRDVTEIVTRMLE